MLKLQRLRSDHAAAVLAFEVANRAYFAVSVTDRGDDFYEQFSERHRALLAEQDAGMCVFHVLLDGDGTVMGRFNLYDLVDGTAEVGYRVAEQVVGRGVATSTLRTLCRLAAEQYGLRTLKAKTSNENVASQRVLEKAGCVSVGPTDVGGRSGTLYECRLDPPAIQSYRARPLGHYDRGSMSIIARCVGSAIARKASSDADGLTMPSMRGKIGRP